MAKVKTLKELKTKARSDGGQKQSETKENLKKITKYQERKERLKEIKENNSKLPFKINKRLSGRPTKYRKEFCQKLIDYFERRTKGGYFEEYVIEEFVGKNGRLDQKIGTRPKPLPTMDGFSVEIGVSMQTMITRCTKKDKDGKLLYPEFIESYKRGLSIQKTMLQELGTTGHYNSNIVKFLLQSDHAMFETIAEQNQTELGQKKNALNEVSIDDELSEFYN